MSTQLVKTSVLGVDITNATKSEVLEYIGEILRKKTKKLFVTTPNPEIVVFAHNHPEFRKVLNDADLALCDGIGLLLASRIMAKPIKERITGIDMMDLLCQMGVDQALNIGLLGARPGVAERAAKCLIRKYPRLNIVFVAPEWSEDGFAVAQRLRRTTQNPTRKNAEENVSAVSRIVPQGSAPVIDVLFVAYGFPKQEQWITKHLPELPVRLAIGVGGSFDMISGEVRRAPFILRMIGFEWLYRLIRQPWRWRRQLSLLSFIKLVFMAKLSSR